MSNEWFYAACTKVQINNEAPFFIDFRDTRFRSLSDQMPNVNYEDLCVLALLSSLFVSPKSFFMEGWGQYLPPIHTSENISPTFIGSIFDVNSTLTYPDTVSFACFTKDILKTFLSNNPPPDTMITDQEWRELVQDTPFDELQALIEAYSADTTAINGEKITLRVMRCTDTEIRDLDPFGGLDAPYFDIFDTVKARLTNTVDELNKMNLAPAKYYPDGEYIEFVSECSISLPIMTPDIPT